MPRKITHQQIQQINRDYYELKNYSAVARKMGISASTVKKYVIKDWIPIDIDSIKKVGVEVLGNIDITKFKDVENYGELCVLTPEEEKEIEELWKEIEI